jgi:hypothetical protein
MLDERALLTLLDEPAPPPVVTLELVLRKGRRQVRVRRVGVVAIVFAMVAVVAGGGMWLRSAAAGQPDDLMAGGDPMLDIEPWTEELQGWSLVAHASCPPVATPADGGTIPAREAVEPVFIAAVSYVANANLTVDLAQWDATSGYLMADYRMDDGAGSVQFNLSRPANGTPVQLADADVNAYGTCAAPMRKVFESGTVMQLYAPDKRSPHAPIQHVRTYLPNGLEYSVTSAGWSMVDVGSSAPDQMKIIQTGRGRLPVSSQQLVEIADRMVQLE